MDAAAVRALRADLEAARFTVDRLTALWGAAADAALERGDRVPAVRAVAASTDPAAVLARVFVLGLDEDAAAVAGSLPALGVAGAAELGLVETAGSRIRPLIDLRPYAFLDARGAGEWWIASDLGELATGAALRTDHVLGVGGASVTLSGLLLPGPVDTALDLGTGCGIQALHLAREARRVVATDISSRALDLARLNAAVNAVTSIEFRLGSLFEPVSEERFDRIASNPPFVITPRGAGVPEYEYRDGGAVGDDLVAGIVRAAAQHLVPGGIAQLLGNWEYRATEDGLQRALGWADDGGLEAWIIERETLDPARYAETWIRDGGTRPASPEYEPLVGAWLDDFAARAVTAVGFGYLLLRRPAGDRMLRRVERIDASLDTGASGLGVHLSAALAAHDLIAPVDDAALLALHPSVAGDVTEERSHWPGAEHPTVITLRQGGGFRREVRVGTALAAVVGACDGELSLGAILGAVASILDVDAAALTAEIVPEVRELVLGGMLILTSGG
ncbi:MAG TPA: methyltransferase [Pseudolysinimonas sp.]|nr:methyltransferase [Pseudolysinimonas sp.]